MKKLLSNVWFSMFSIVLLTVLGLIFALYDSYKTVWTTISHLDPVRLVLIIILGVFTYLGWGAILTIFGRTIDPKYTFKNGVINAYVGGFMSGITPSSTGGQFAQIYAYRKAGLKSSQGAGLISMDFFLYQISYVILAIVLYVVYLSTYTGFAISVIFAISLFLNSFVVIVMWIMVQFPKLYHRLSYWAIILLHKAKFVKNKEKILETWNGTLTHFSESIEAISQNKKVFWVALSLNILRFLAYFSTPFFIAVLLDIPVTADQFLPILSLAGFVSIANTFVPLPGASGATESLFVLVMATIVGKGAAASIMILWRFTNFYVPVIFGGWLFIRLRNLKITNKFSTADLLGEDK